MAHSRRVRPLRLLAVCYKACAGHFVCWLFATRQEAGQLHLPAVFAARSVPVGSSAGCFTTRPVPVSFTTGPFCHNGLVLPCHALPACLCHDPMPAALVSYLPLFITMCARIIALAAGLPCRQPHHGTALVARAPCLFASIHPSIHPPFIACVCLRQCPFSVLQGLPCRQPHMETTLVEPVHRLCSLRSFHWGGLGLHWCSRPHSLYNTCMRFMSQRLRVSSLAPCFFPHRVHRSWAMV